MSFNAISKIWLPTSHLNASTARRSVLSPYIFILLSVFFLATIGSVNIFISGAKNLTAPYVTSVPEPFILYGAERVVHDFPLYPKLGGEPFIINVYNPLTYLPAAYTGKIFRLSQYGILLVGRIISFVSTLLLLAIVAVCLWKKTGAWQWALFSTVAILYFQRISLTDFFRMRPESPGLFFTFAGFLLLQHRERPRPYIVAAAFFFMAFLFKQSFIAAPISVCIYLSAEKEFKGALKFSAALGCLICIFFAIMSIVTENGYFQHTMLSMAINSVSPIQKLRLMHGPKVLYSAWALFIVLIPTLGLLIIRLEERPLLVYFFVSLLWTLYSAGKIGASLNYYSELAILSIIIITTVCGTLYKRNQPAALLLLSVLAVQVVISATDVGILGRRIQVSRDNISRYVQKYKEDLRNKFIMPGGIAVQAGQIVALDWCLLNDLEKKGVITLQPIFNHINRGDYDLIVLPQNQGYEIESRITDAVSKGPYQKTYSDEVVSEWSKSSHSPP